MRAFPTDVKQEVQESQEYQEPQRTIRTIKTNKESERKASGHEARETFRYEDFLSANSQAERDEMIAAAQGHLQASLNAGQLTLKSSSPAAPEGATGPQEAGGPTLR